MAWVIFGFIAATVLLISYVFWRGEHPDAAKQFERRLARTLGQAVRGSAVTAGNAAKVSAKVSARAATASVQALEKQLEVGRAARAPMRWYGMEQVTVRGLQIDHALTYVGQATADEPSRIDLGLAVQSPSGPSPQLSYWPRYEHLSPQQRYIYLGWMADGRKQMPPELGYAFIFFYGLERRALVEREDLRVITQEIMRLRRLHKSQTLGFSGSFENYSSSLLSFLAASTPHEFDLALVRELMASISHWNEDKLAATLSWFATREQPLPDWAAIMVAGELPQSQRSNVLARVPDEFQRLFFRRYKEKFGQGMSLRVSARDRVLNYQTASAAIGHCSCHVPNVLGIASQFKPLTKIWNDSVADLRKLSTVVGKQGYGEVTVAAWEAMPAELRARVDHPLTDAFCQLVDRWTDEEGHTLVPMGELAALMQVESKARVTPGQGRRISETAAHVGYGIEPDSWLTGRGYGTGEQVAVFLRTSDENTDTGRYSAAACVLRLGMMVAAADGHVHADEVALITQHIEHMFNLNDTEQRRLESLRAVLLKQGADTTGISALVKNLPGAQREALGKLLLALAAEDGVITKEEIRAVRQCYRTLGLDDDEVDAALRTLHATRCDEPVVVRPAGHTPAGESLPPQPAEAEAFRLDRSTIQGILIETRGVAAMLAQAMNVEQETVSDVTEGTTTAVTVAAISTSPPSTTADQVATSLVTASPAGLPQRYAALYHAIVGRPQWEMTEAAELARKYGLMLSGAVEAINDWSTEQLGASILYEDGDSLVVEESLLN